MRNKLNYIILLLIFFITNVHADYYVIPNQTLKLYIPIYNNNSNRLIIYAVYPPKKYCKFNNTLLPIIVKPFSEYYLPIYCKFPEGKYNVSLKLLEINNKNYPSKIIYLNIVSKKSDFYVLINGGIINSTKYLYKIKLGDLIKIIYKNNKIPFQYPTKIKILYIGNYNNSTYYIYARAIKPGFDSIYLNNLTSIDFKITISKNITNYLEEQQLVYLIYNITNNTNYMFKTLQNNISNLSTNVKKQYSDLKKLLTSYLQQYHNIQLSNNKKYTYINKTLKNISSLLLSYLKELKQKDKTIEQLEEQNKQLQLENQKLKQQFTSLSSNVNNINSNYIYYMNLSYLLFLVVLVLIASLVSGVVYVKFVLLKKYKQYISYLENRIKKLIEE